MLNIYTKNIKRKQQNVRVSGGEVLVSPVCPAQGLLGENISAYTQQKRRSQEGQHLGMSSPGRAKGYTLAQRQD